MTCAIVIPVFKEIPNSNERVSLLQCLKVFGKKYPIRALAPRGLRLGYYYALFKGASDFKRLEFSPKYFRSPQTYNRFMKSTKIYEALNDYDYFLMYHTDAYVFRDELEYWMKKGYDNIGAPIYRYDGTIEPEEYVGVGNSGFSLHKIAPAMKVLRSFKKVYPLKDFLKWYGMYNWRGKIRHFPYLIRMIFGLGGWSHHLLNYSKLNEDIFWGVQVPARFPEYKVAPFEEAYKFSMEYNCKKLLDLNEGKLPFGCHQWYKGRFLNFWKDKIEKQGYSLERIENTTIAK